MIYIQSNSVFDILLPSVNYFRITPLFDYLFLKAKCVRSDDTTRDICHLIFSYADLPAHHVISQLPLIHKSA